MTTRRGPGLALLALLASCLTLAAPAGASHRIFGSKLDRFEIDGNVFGSADGALDFVDDFNGTDLSAEWERLLGTSIVSGGYVSLQNPGTDVNLTNPPIDVSNIEHEDAVVNGAGNFTATSYWQPVLPADHTEFHFQTYALGGVIEAVGVIVTSQPAVAFGRTIIGNTAESTSQVFPITGSPTGAIVLRLSFDDATDTMNCSFSLDGGTTFQSPFTPVAVFTHGLTSTELLLGAAYAEDVPPPPPPPPPGTPRFVPTTVFQVKRNLTSDKRTFVYKGRDDDYGAPNVPNGNPTVNGATFNVNLDGTQQCFHLPSYGWKAGNKPFTYTYKDKVGTFGPVTTALLRLRFGTRLDLKLVATNKHGPINLVPGSHGEGDTILRLKNSDGVYCSRTTGGTVSANDSRQFRVKNAPAPTGCYVAPCSPSGAFLDDDPGF